MNWLTIPNALTILRMIFTPWILLELAHGHWMTGGWMLGGAAFTDSLDGWLARHFRWQSKAGQFLDPIADKFLLTSIFVGLAAGGAVPVWLVFVIVGRDLWIVGLSAFALKFTKYRNLTPSVWGKFSTFSQVLTAVAIIATRAYGNPLFSEAADVLVWVVTALALISCADYSYRGIAYLRRR